VRLLRLPIAGDNSPCKSKPFSSLQDPNINIPTQRKDNFRGLKVTTSKLNNLTEKSQCGLLKAGLFAITRLFTVGV
jgi:hypothetical protein